MTEPSRLKRFKILPLQQNVRALFDWKRMESNSSYCQPHLLWSRANIHYSYSDFGSNRFFFFLDLFIQGSNRFLSPATLLWMELLSVKNHNVFPNESDYFINADQGSVLCRGISNLLSCLLQFWNHCWRQELLCVFQGPKLQSFLLHTIRLRISGWLLRSFEMDGNFQGFLSSDFVQIY